MFSPLGMNIARGGVYDTATQDMLVNHTYRSDVDDIATIVTNGYFPDYFGGSVLDVVVGDIVEIFSAFELATVFYQVATPAPLTIVPLSSITGNVEGPVSSTDNAIARFDGTTGGLIQNSLVTIDDSGILTTPTSLVATTSVLTPSLDTPSAGAMLIGSGNATSITVGAPTTITQDLTLSTNLGVSGVITNSSLSTGVVHSDSSGVFTSSTIVNADVNAAAGIVDTKLATISTAGKVANSATTATDANTVSTIVARDASGNFIAGTVTVATGAIFPTAGGTPGTLNAYENGSFSVTWTGALTNTVTVNFTRIGKSVTLVFADNTASTAAAAGIVAATSTIPARILPAYDVNKYSIGQDNASASDVTFEVFTNGAIKVGKGQTSIGTFTNAAVGGYFSTAVTYICV